MALARHRNSGCWRPFKVCWEQRDSASRHWKSWFLLNFYCHVLPGEFVKLHHTSSPQLEWRTTRTFAALVTTWDTLMSSKTGWERRPASVGCPMQQNQRQPVHEIFAKDANNVPDPAHAVYPWCNSQKNLALAALLSYQMLQRWASAGPSPNSWSDSMQFSISHGINPSRVEVSPEAMSAPCFSTEIFPSKALCTFCLLWSGGKL